MPKIKELNVNFISLVDEPANRKPIVYKSKDGTAGSMDLAIKLVSKDAKEGLLYGVVYEPDTVDTQGDWADADTIKRAAHDFMTKSKVQMVDFQHNYEPGSGTVVESHILTGKNANYPDVKEGSWVVAIKVAETMREKMDKIGGLSLAGTATFDPDMQPPQKSAQKSDSGARIFKNNSPARVHMPARVIKP